MGSVAKRLIEEAAEGRDPKEQVQSIVEGLDSYSMSYRLEDLLSCASGGVSATRSLLMKFKAYEPSANSNQTALFKSIIASLESAMTKLGEAEAEVVESIKVLENFKKSSPIGGAAAGGLY